MLETKSFDFGDPMSVSAPVHRSASKSWLSLGSSANNGSVKIECHVFFSGGCGSAINYSMIPVLGCSAIMANPGLLQHPEL